MERNIKYFKCKKCKTTVSTRGYIEEYCDSCLSNIQGELWEIRNSIDIRARKYIKKKYNLEPNWELSQIEDENIKYIISADYSAKTNELKDTKKYRSIYSLNKKFAISIQRMAVRKYQKTDKGKNAVTESITRRKNSLKEAGNFPPDEIILKRLNLFGENICCYCNKNDKLEIEHLRPISKNGTNEEHNLFGVCSKCNKSKGNNNWRKWFRKQKFYKEEREKQILRHSRKKK